MTTYESLSNARKQLQNARKSERANARSTYLWGFSLLALAACGSDPAPGNPAPFTPPVDELPPPSTPVGLPGAVSSGDELKVVAIQGQFVDLQLTDATATYLVTDADGNEVAVSGDMFYAATTGEYTVTINDLVAAEGKTVADARFEINRAPTVDAGTFIESAEAKTKDGKSQIEIFLVGATVDDGTDVGLTLKSGDTVIEPADYTVSLVNEVITVTFEDDKAPASFADLSFELGGTIAPTSKEVAIVDSTDTSAPTLVSATGYDGANTGRALEIIEYSDVTVVSVGAEGTSVIIVLSAPVAYADGSVLADLLADLTITSGTGDSAVTLTIDTSAGSLDSNVIQVTLTSAVAAGDAITVAYSGDSLVDASERPFQGTLTTSAVNSTAAVAGADPVVTSVAVDSTDATMITITFDKAIGAAADAAYADLGDFSVMADGAANAVTAASINGAVLTLTLTTAVDDNATLSVGYDATGSDTLTLQSTDATAVAVADVTNSAATNLHGVAPTVSNVGVDGDTMIVAFNQDLAGDAATAGDFTIAGTTATITVTTATISGNLLTLTLSEAVAAADTTPTVAYTASGTTDLTGVAGTAVGTIAAADATNITGTAPAVATATVDGASVVLTFNRDIAAGTTEVADFMVKVDGVPQTVDAVAFGTNTATLTLNPALTHDAATITVEYTGSGTDKLVSTDTTAVAVADIAAAAQAVGNITVDAAAAPATSSIEVYGSTVVVTFDKDLATDGAYAEVGDFTVSNGVKDSEVANIVTAASVSGNVLTLTLTTAVTASDSVLFSYDADSQDTVTLAAESDDTAVMDFADAKIAVAPMLTGSYATGTTVYLVFDAAVAQETDKADFTVMTGGDTNTVATVTVVGSVVALTLTDKIADSDVVSVSVAADKLAGLNGANIDLTTAVTVDPANIDGLTPPTISGITVNGVTVEITFSANLTDVAAYADTGDFTLTGIGDTNSISGASVAGAVVTLTLSAAVASDAEVTVAYDSAGTGTETLKDANDLTIANTESPVAATNNTPTIPTITGTTVDGVSLVLTFSEDLAGSTYADTEDFTVMVTPDGGVAAAATVSSVTISGDKVTLTLSTAVVADDAVTVAYDPEGHSSGTATLVSDDDGAAVAATTEAAAVTNNTTAPAAPAAPALEGTVVDVTANTITLTYDVALTAVASGTATTDFTVSIGGVDATTLTVEVTGTTAILTVGDASGITDGAAVSIAYTPTSGSEQITNAAEATLVAAAIPATVVANELDAVTGIALDSTATKIVLTFANAITTPAAGAYADAADFTVTVDGTAVTGHTVAVASDGTVEVTLPAAVTAGQTVEVAYNSAGAATVALENSDGVVGNFDTANKTATAVTGIPTVSLASAPAVTGATVSADGTIVTLTFDKALDSADLDAAAAASYEITAGSATYTPATATLDGTTVTLTLASGSAIFQDAAVSVKILAELDASDDATDPVAADTTVASTDVTNDSTEVYSGPTAIARDIFGSSSYSIILNYNADISGASFAASDFSVKYGRDDSQSVLDLITVDSAKSISDTEIELTISSAATLDDLDFRVDYTGSESSLEAIGGTESFAVANEIDNGDHLVLEFDDDILFPDNDAGFSVELTLANGNVATVVSSDIFVNPFGNSLVITLPQDVDLANDGSGAAYTQAVVKYTGTSLTDSSGNAIVLGDDNILATINNPSGVSDTAAPVLASGSAENNFNSNDDLQARVYLTFNEGVFLIDDFALVLDADGVSTGDENFSGALQFEENFTVRIGDDDSYQLRGFSYVLNNNVPLRVGGVITVNATQISAWIVDADGNPVVLGRDESIHISYTDANLNDSTRISDVKLNTVESIAETKLSTVNVVEFDAPTSTTEVSSARATSAAIAGEANETIQAVFYKVRATTDAAVATDDEIYDGGNGSAGSIAADGTSYSFTASPEGAAAGTDYVVDILLIDHSGNTSVVSQYFNTAVELASGVSPTAENQAVVEETTTSGLSATIVSAVADGTMITLTMSGALSGALSSADGFVVTVGGVAATISSVAGADASTSVVITLADSVAQGEVVVTLDAGTAVTSTNETDFWITGMSITKGDSTADPVVTDKLVISTNAEFADQATADTFGTAKLAIADFMLQDLSDTGTNIPMPDGSTITVATDGTITIDLTATSGLDITGSKLYQLSHTVTTATANGLADATAIAQAAVVVIESVSVAADGTVVVTFDEEVAATTQVAGWSVTVNGAATAINPDAVASDGATVTLTLPDASITVNDTVTVSYDPSVTDADVKGAAITWLAGGVVASAATDASATNTNIGVSLESAAVNGTSLVLTLSGSLGDTANSAVDVSGLIVKVGDTPVDLDGLSASFDAAGTTLSLTLPSAVSHDSEVTVSFTQADDAKNPGSIVNFAETAVTNDTQAPVTGGDTTGPAPTSSNGAVAAGTADGEGYFTATLNENALVYYTFAASDATFDDLSGWSSVSTQAGANASADSNWVRIDYTSDQAGTNSLHVAYVAADDGAYTISSFTPAFGNTAPSISASNAIAIDNADEDAQVVTIAVDGLATADALTTSTEFTGNNTGLTVAASDGNLVFTVAAGTDLWAGSREITAVVSDGTNTDTTLTFDLTVAADATDTTGISQVKDGDTNVGVNDDGTLGTQFQIDGASTANNGEYYTVNFVVVGEGTNVPVAEADLIAFVANASVGFEGVVDAGRVSSTEATWSITATGLQVGGRYDTYIVLTDANGNATLVQGYGDADYNGANAILGLTGDVTPPEFMTQSLANDTNGDGTVNTTEATGGIVVTYTFSEEVWDVDKDDFDVTGGNISGLSSVNPVNGIAVPEGVHGVKDASPAKNVTVPAGAMAAIEWAVTITPTDNTVTEVTVKLNSSAEIYDDPIASLDVNAYDSTNVAGLETVVIDQVSAKITALTGVQGTDDQNTVVVTLSFDDGVADVGSITAAMFSVTGGSVTNVSAGAANQVLVTIDAVDGEVLTGASLDFAPDGAIKDTVGNTLADQTAVASITLDGKAAAITALTNAEGTDDQNTVEFALNFDDNLDVSKITAAMFSVTGGTVTGVSAGGAANQVMVTIDAVDGAVLTNADLNFSPDGALLDTAGNTLGNQTAVAPITLDGKAAAVATVAATGAGTNQSVVTLTFDDTMTGSDITISDFVVKDEGTEDTSSVFAVSDVAIGSVATQVLVTVSGIGSTSSDSNFDLDFATGASFTDAAGNTVSPTAGSIDSNAEDINLDTVAATINTIDVAQGNDDTNNVVVSLTFDDGFTFADLDASMFTVTGATVSELTDDTGTSDLNDITLKITASVGSVVTGQSIVFTAPTGANAIMDTAGNTLADQTVGGNGKVTLDGVAAKIQDLDTSYGNADINTVDVVLTFDDNIDIANLTATMFTVNGATVNSVADNTATQELNDIVLTITANTGSVVTNESIVFTPGTFNDKAGNNLNTQTVAGTGKVTLDGVAATVKDITVGVVNGVIGSDNDNSVSVELTFDDNINNGVVDASMFELSGSLTKGTDYTITGSAIASNKITLLITATGVDITAADIVFTPPTGVSAITDTAGNVLVMGTVGGAAVTLDGKVAELGSVTPTGLGDTVVITLAFDDDLSTSTVSKDDFVLVGGTGVSIMAATLGGAGNNLILVTVEDGGTAVDTTFALHYDSANIEDGAGNTVVTTNGLVPGASGIVLDSVIATLDSVSVNIDNPAGTVVITLTFDDELNSGSVSGADFALSGDSGVSITAAAVDSSDTKLVLVTVTDSGTDVDATFALDYSSNATIVDAGGNTVSTSGAVAGATGINIDTVAAAIEAANTQVTGAGTNTVVVTLDFDDDLTNDITIGDFVVNEAGTTSVSGAHAVTGVSVTNDKVAVTVGLSGTSDDENIDLYFVSGASFTDAAGNTVTPTAGLITGANNINVDTKAATIEAANTQVTGAGSNTVVVTLDFDDDLTNDITIGDFVVNEAGTTNVSGAHAVTGVSVTNDKVAVTVGLSGTRDDENIDLHFATGASFTDVAGNTVTPTAGLITGANNINVDTEIAALDTVSVVVDNAGRDVVITLAFDDELNSGSVDSDGSDFATSGGSGVSVTGAAVGGTNSDLILVTVTDGGNPVNAIFALNYSSSASIVDGAGNTVSTTPVAITGASGINLDTIVSVATAVDLDVTLGGNILTVTLDFDQNIEASPAIPNFRLTDGSGAAVSNISVTSAARDGTDLSKLILELTNADMGVIDRVIDIEAVGQSFTNFGGTAITGTLANNVVFDNSTAPHTAHTTETGQVAGGGTDSASADASGKINKSLAVGAAPVYNVTFEFDHDIADGSVDKTGSAANVDFDFNITDTSGNGISSTSATIHSVAAGSNANEIVLNFTLSASSAVDARITARLKNGAEFEDTDGNSWTYNAAVEHNLFYEIDWT